MTTELQRPQPGGPIPRRAIVLAVALLAPLMAPGLVGAEPGEDGADADPPTYYVSDPTAGWMTERSGDRVHDFAQIGNTVYVAGTFTNVRPTSTGPLTPQSYLAAFDATTGVHIPGFDPDLNSSVYSLAVADDGSRLYVGGAFTEVNGAPRRRLVALDPASGDVMTGWETDVSGGSVRSVVVAGGSLFVGGNFSSVEGAFRRRLAKLDAQSGLLDGGWQPQAFGNAVLTVEVPTDQSRVYLGGRFASVDGVPATEELVALDPGTGAVDPGFVGQPGREVFDLLATDDGRLWVAEGGGGGRAEVYDSAGTLLERWDTDGDVQVVEQVGERVLFGGHNFGPSENMEVAAVDPGDLEEFDIELFSPPTNGGDGVWAFHATGADLWLGGQQSQPAFGFSRYASTAPPLPAVPVIEAGDDWRYLDDGSEQGTAWRAPGFDDSSWAVGPAELGFGDDDEATEVTEGHITYWFRRTLGVPGGASMTGARLRVLADDGAVAYVNGTEVARLRMLNGPTTAQTLADDTAWGPEESTFNMFSVPDGLLVDGANTVAVEIHQAAPTSSDISFDLALEATPAAPPDTEDPSVPTGLSLTGPPSETSADLTWTASTDDVGVHHYDVLVDSVVVGPAATPGFTVTGLSPATTYQVQVEAVDAAGNRSGPTAALPVTTADPPAQPNDLIELGSTWRYLDDGSDQGTAWRQPGFDDAAWPSGPAELGRADGDEATVLDWGAVTYWFRRSFVVTDVGDVSSLDLGLLADDGAVVYVNGAEVVRDNMAPGPVGHLTNAVDYRWGGAETAIRPFSLAPGTLQEGVNVLAVEVHQAPNSFDLSFDARLETMGGTTPEPDTNPPSVPDGLALAAPAGPTSVDLVWNASTDDVAVDHYDITADGNPVATTASTSATVPGLTPGTPYDMAVEAVDLAGNRSGPSSILPVVTAAPGAQPVLAVPKGAVWRYLDTGVDPAPSWTMPGFNDSSWPQGPAQLGMGDGDEATVTTHGHVTYRFRRWFSVDGAAGFSELDIDLLADDGAVVYLNGVEVVRDNMPGGPIGSGTLASTYRWGSAENAFRSFTAPASMLLEGGNTVTVEVHQADAGSLDLGLDLELMLVP